MKTIPGWSPPVLLLTAALAYCMDLPTEQISAATSAAESPSSPQRLIGPETLAKFWDNGQAINVAVSAGSEQSLLEGAASTAAGN